MLASIHSHQSIDGQSTETVDRLAIFIPTADGCREKSCPSIDTNGTFPNDKGEPVSRRYFTLSMVTMVCPSMMSLGNRGIFVSLLYSIDEQLNNQVDVEDKATGCARQIYHRMRHTALGFSLSLFL